MNFTNFTFVSDPFTADNRSFLVGDSVQATFLFRNGNLILGEDVYFFLMASMRKMRMKIPLNYTLDFFQNLFTEKLTTAGVADAFIQFLVYRNTDDAPLQKSGISYFVKVQQTEDVLAVKQPIALDMIKEITVGHSLLSNIQVHCAENIYAEIYAKENNLDDLILLNSQKRIARSIYGNLLLLKDNLIKVPKQSEGAYISPLMESFITFVHKNKLAEIEEAELIAFETQKSDEILMISDSKGIFPVSQIRNKSFSNCQFAIMLNAWKATF